MSDNDNQGDEGKQPETLAVNDDPLAIAAHQRLDYLEEMLKRVVRHLDPSGTSRSLFPVDTEGNPL